MIALSPEAQDAIDEINAKSEVEARGLAQRVAENTRTNRREPAANLCLSCGKPADKHRLYCSESCRDLVQRGTTPSPQIAAPHAPPKTEPPAPKRAAVTPKPAVALKPAKATALSRARTAANLYQNLCAWIEKGEQLAKDFKAAGIAPPDPLPR